MRPLLYIDIGNGREIALTLTTREAADATRIAERQPTAAEVVDAVRILKGGLLTDSRITTRATLEPRLA